MDLKIIEFPEFSIQAWLCVWAVDPGMLAFLALLFTPSSLMSRV